MRPNIIFYFSDQQRHDTVCQEVTPNLYNFSKDCCIEAPLTFTCQPVCGPARACIQTGLYASKNGCYRNDISINESLPCIGSLFDDDGYDTAYIGKWHLASDGFDHAKTAIPPQKQGGYRYVRMADCLEFTSNGSKGYLFDENGAKHNFEGVRSDCINDFAIEYLEQRKSEKPFFMFVSQLEPHHQNDSGKFECAKDDEDKFVDYPLPSDLENCISNAKKNYSDYLSLCHRLDKNIGELTDILKEKNLWDNTVIIYTSDHSCHFRSRNPEYKRSAHDNSTHIPFLLFGGGLAQLLREKNISQTLPCTYNELLSLVDFAPTLLDIAGIKPPQSFDGFSLLSMLGGKTPHRKNVYIEISESQLGRAIRTKKYIYSIKAPHNLGCSSAKAKIYKENLLYEIESDADNKINLIKSKKFAPVRQVLKKELLDEMAKHDDIGITVKRKFFQK